MADEPTIEKPVADQRAVDTTVARDPEVTPPTAKPRPQGWEAGLPDIKPPVSSQEAEPVEAPKVEQNKGVPTPAGTAGTGPCRTKSSHSESPKHDRAADSGTPARASQETVTTLRILSTSSGSADPPSVKHTKKDQEVPAVRSSNQSLEGFDHSPGAAQVEG